MTSTTMLDLLRNRRSIRKYASLSIETEKIELLQEAALRSPTSRNFNPWRFVFVDNRNLIMKLASCKPHGSSFLEEAPLAIIVAANENESDVWIEDCSIASILIQMTAQSLGLGSCWIQIRLRQHNPSDSSEAYIRHLIGAPDHIRIESIIAIGYPNEIKEPIETDELEYEKVFMNRLE